MWDPDNQQTNNQTSKHETVYKKRLTLLAASAERCWLAPRHVGKGLVSSLLCWFNWEQAEIYANERWHQSRMPPLHKGGEQRAKVAPLFPGKSAGSSSSAAPARAIVIQSTSMHIANLPEEEEGKGGGSRPENQLQFCFLFLNWNSGVSVATAVERLSAKLKTSSPSAFVCGTEWKSECSRPDELQSLKTTKNGFRNFTASSCHHEIFFNMNAIVLPLWWKKPALETRRIRLIMFIGRRVASACCVRY